MKNGVILHTKSGKVIGNAIIYGIYKKNFAYPEMFLIETDFGNQLRLTGRELLAWFSIGPKTSIQRWKTDRSIKRALNEIRNNENRYLAMVGYNEQD